MIRAEDTIFYSIERTIKAYRKLAQSKIKQVDPSISVDQSWMIKELLDNPDSSQVDLANLLFKDVASITRMMELMVKKGFVHRRVNPENRRRNLLEVSKKGKRVVDKISPATIKNRENALKGISKKELKACRAVLDKIFNNLFSNA